MWSIWWFQPKAARKECGPGQPSASCWGSCLLCGLDPVPRKTSSPISASICKDKKEKGVRGTRNRAKILQIRNMPPRNSSLLICFVFTINLGVNGCGFFGFVFLFWGRGCLGLKYFGIRFNFPSGTPLQKCMLSFSQWLLAGPHIWMHDGTWLRQFLHLVRPSLRCHFRKVPTYGRD